ncbi:hypothetical protein D3C73_1295060 [compost metagenome]
MIIRCCKNQGLTIRFRVDIFSERLQHYTIEIIRDHRLIELSHFEINFVFQHFFLHGSQVHIIYRYFLTNLPLDAVLLQFRFKLNGRLMVDQIAINDSFTVGVVKDCFVKNLNRMKSWSSR